MKTRRAIAYSVAALSVVVVSPLLVPACVGYADCHDGRYCPGDLAGGAAGSSGGALVDGGSGGGGGNDSAGSGAISGNSSGGNGDHAGESGTGSGPAGAGGALPCGGDCNSQLPVCDESANTCVECLNIGDCDSLRPVCDDATKTCVVCTATAGCKDSSKAFCDTTAQLCVACLTDGDCKDSSAARCEAGSCKPCTDNTQCAHVVGKTVCDATGGQCVQCTSSDYTACGKDSSSQTPFVCDSLKHVCSTNKEHDAGLCIPCVSDANCALGEMCVLQKFKSADVGYFCEWKQGDTANGAPADCTATGQPYVGVVNGAKSIDGQTADICTLRKTTCVARNQFSQKDCAVASAPSDSLCGFSPPDDAKCTKFGITTFRCTMRCLSSDDCPGTTCDTGLAQPVCNFQ